MSGATQAVMQSQLIESMCDQARAIHRVATGSEMPEWPVSGAEPDTPVEEVTRLQSWKH